MSFRQSERAEGESGCGLGVEVELGVICVAVEVNAVFSEYIAKREEIDNKKQHRQLVVPKVSKRQTISSS